jgi:WD40 repeat protein
LSLSLLLGVEAYNSQDNYRTRVSLLDNVNVQPKLIRTLVKHSSWVKDVAFSPDGNILATSSCAHYELATIECSNGEFILWDMNSNQSSPRLFQGHSGWIYAVAFDPDPGKKILATAGGDNIIIFWNMETGDQISQSPSVHSNSVLSLAFSPNGKYLVSGDGDGLIILWDLQSQTHKQLFTAAGPIKTLAFGPDSQLIAFGNCSSFDTNRLVKCDRPTVNLLSVETGEFIAEQLQGHADLIETVAFSSSGKLLASGSYDNTVMLWNLEDLENDQQGGEPLSGHLDWVHSVVFINDGLLASGSADGTVALWNTETLENIGELKGHSDWVTGLAIDPDKKILASASDDKTIMLWDIQGHRKPFGEPLAVPNKFPFGIAFNPISGILATTNVNPGGGVLFWDGNSGSQISGAIDIPLIAGALAYSLDGKKLATGGADGSIIYWNADTLPPTPQGEPLAGHSSPILRLSFSHDGHLLASTSVDGVGNIWNLNTNPNAILRTFSLQSQFGDPGVLIFSPIDDNLIAYGSDNNLVIHNIKSEEKNIFAGLLDTVSDVAFSPDGKTVAASSYGEIMLWDLSTGQKQGVSLTSQSGNIGEIWRLAFSPDGKTLASRGCGEVDSTANCIEHQIYLWDVESTQLIGAITMGEETPDAMTPFALSFSPDGNYLVSTGCAVLSEEGCKEGQIYRWIIAPQLWVENSCLRAGRNLTRAEWEKFGFTETYRQTCAQWSLEPIETATPVP